MTMLLSFFANNLQYFANILSVISYDMARKHGTGSVLESFMYANIMLILFSPFFAYALKKYKNIDVFNITLYLKNKKMILFLLPSILLTFFKSYLCQNASQQIVNLFKLISPAISLFITVYILKEKQNSKNFKYYFLGMFTTFALMQFATNKMTIGLHIGVLIYTLIDCCSDILKRAVAKSRNKYEGVAIENMLFLPIGITMFSLAYINQIYYTEPLNNFMSLIQVNTFQFKKLFSLQVFILALISGAQHTFSIIAFKETKTMQDILIANFFKSFITGLSGYVFFGTTISLSLFLATSVMIILTAIYYKK
jgi:hypothetical protein